MSRNQALQIYQQVFASWPKQALRPDYQLQDVLRKAVQERYPRFSPQQEAEEMEKARALQMLQADRLKHKYPFKGTLLKPKSQPQYFEVLCAEIEEAPKRTWFQRALLRVTGLVRMQ